MTLRILASVMAVWAFAYLIGAFVALTWDPRRWTAETRAVLCALAATISVFAVIIGSVMSFTLAMSNP